MKFAIDGFNALEKLFEQHLSNIREYVLARIEGKGEETLVLEKAIVAARAGFVTWMQGARIQ